MMVRSLTDELQKKAIEELNEVPERVEEDIKTIQKWIKQQPHLNASTDEQWILGFLRGCKFSLQTTKDKLDTFYSIKHVTPETMVLQSVYSANVQAMLKAGIVLPMKNPENYTGPKVILLRYHNSDPHVMSLTEIVAMLFMVLKILMVEDDNMMVSGVLLWNDISQLPLSYMLQVTPKLLQDFFTCIQNAFPLRLQGLQYSGAPGLAKTCFNLFKNIVSAKLRERVVIYDEDCFENEKKLKILSRQIIPKEYGGENGSVEDIAAYWKDKVESYSDWFIKENQYCTDETKRPGKPLLDGLIGIDGSFRKLNVD